MAMSIKAKNPKGIRRSVLRDLNDTSAVSRLDKLDSFQFSSQLFALNNRVQVTYAAAWM